MTPPKPVEEDLYEFSDEKLAAMKIDTLPATLGAAVLELQKDPVAKEALGEHTYGKYIEAKNAEWDGYRLYVSQWELDKYLEVY